MTADAITPKRSLVALAAALVLFGAAFAIGKATTGDSAPGEIKAAPAAAAEAIGSLSNPGEIPDLVPAPVSSAPTSSSTNSGSTALAPIQTDAPVVASPPPTGPALPPDSGGSG